MGEKFFEGPVTFNLGFHVQKVPKLPFLGQIQNRFTDPGC